MKNVVIYTDGACSGNPGPGGWAAILRSGDREKEISGCDPMTTNNRMELSAALYALKALKMPCEVDLYSDSTYLIDAVNCGWLANWIRRGWKKANGDKVENPDLWQELARCMRLHEIRWHKVKGHAGDPCNERCDEMARKAVRLAKENSPDRDGAP